MEDLIQVLDIIVKYGLPMIISGLAVWGVVDLYLSLKKQWAPEFLGSFKSIAEDIKGLSSSVKELAEQSPKIDTILATVTEVRSFLKVGS